MVAGRTTSRTEGDLCPPRSAHASGHTSKQVTGFDPDNRPSELNADPIDARLTGRGTFAALRVPMFRRLWIGGVFTFLSLQMLFLVRGFLAFELTGTTSSLGVMFLGFGITMVLVTPFGGVAADRLGKRRVMIVGQSLTTVVSTSIGFAIIFDAISFWMLVVGSVAQGVSFALVGPARVAFTAQLVGRENLGNGMVLMQMALNSTRIVGPSVAGVLVGVSVVGAEGVYLISAGLMVLSLVFTFLLPAGEPVVDVSGRPLRDLADGVAYVRSQPRLMVLMSTAMFAVMVGFPYIAFLPSLVGDAYGILGEDARARAIAGLSATQAVGAVAATFFVARRADGPRVWLEQALWGLGFGMALMLLGLAPVYALGLVVIVLAGAAHSAFQSLNNALVLTMVDARYHGRVQSLMLVGFGASGIMAAPLGVLADQIGLRGTLAIMGAIDVGIVTAFLLTWSRLADSTSPTEISGFARVTQKHPTP